MAEHDSSRDEMLDRSRQAGHELRDASIFKVVIVGISLLALVAFSMAGAYWLIVASSPDKLPPPPQYERVPDSPTLMAVREQANQHMIRLAQEARNNRRLNTYGWVNREAGIAHIPITRAMELLAARGAAWAPTEPQADPRSPNSPDAAEDSGGDAAPETR